MATWREHLAISNRFRDQGLAEVESGDLLQGSVKLWGAAAHAVKAAAEQRGWKHKSHRSLYDVVKRLAAETGDSSFDSRFKVISEFHVNFYEADMSHELIVDRLETLEDFLRVVRLAIGSYSFR